MNSSWEYIHNTGRIERKWRQVLVPEYRDIFHGLHVLSPAEPFCPLSFVSWNLHFHSIFHSFLFFLDTVLSTAQVQMELQTTAPSFPFLQLPLEVRHIIYREIVSQRTIVLRDRERAGFCTSRVYGFYLTDDHHTREDIIALFQLSKQVYSEARLLLPQTPCHLILSKNLHSIPKAQIHDIDSISEDIESKIGVPLKHITSVSFHIKSLDLRDATESYDLFPESPICFPGLEIGNSPSQSSRISDLDGIEFTSAFLTKSFPALRELHIYDTLKRNLIPSKFSCPAAGNELCNCEISLALPNPTDASIPQLTDSLYRVLLSRFRAALPTWPLEERLAGHLQPDYHTILDLLAHGVHLFFHDQISISIPHDKKAKPESHLHKGHWNAVYYLAPPDNARIPAQPSTEIAERPKQRRLAWEQAEQVRRENFDIEAYFTSRADIFDFSSSLLLTTNSKCKFKFRDLPDGFDGQQPLVSFEAGLQLNIMDEKLYDSISQAETITAGGPEGPSHAGHKSLWKWDWLNSRRSERTSRTAKPTLQCLHSDYSISEVYQLYHALSMTMNGRDIGFWQDWSIIGHLDRFATSAVYWQEESEQRRKHSNFTHKSGWACVLMVKQLY